MLRLEVKLTEVLDFEGAHLGPHEMLQEVVEHGDDPLRQEWVHKDAFDLCKSQSGANKTETRVLLMVWGGKSAAPE